MEQQKAKKTHVALPLLGFLGDDDGVPGRITADPAGPGVDGVDSNEDECVLILT